MTPVSLATVPFYGGHLFAADGEYTNPGDRPIPLRPACERLGIDLSSQLAKLKGKPWACLAMIATQMPGDDQVREYACLPLRAIPMWLASINASKVASELRTVLLAYQVEAADALYRHFMPQVANDAGAITPDMLASVVALLSSLQEQVSQLRAERSGPPGVLGENKAEAWVKKPIRALARQLAPLEGETYKSQRPRLENGLRFAVEFFGPWETLPEGRLHAVQRYLFETERQIFRRMQRRGRGLAKTSPAQLRLALPAQARPN